MTRCWEDSTWKNLLGSTAAQNCAPWNDVMKQKNCASWKWSTYPYSFSEPLNKLISLQEGSDLSTCQAWEHTTGIHPQRGCCHLILKESYGIAMPKSCFHAMAYCISICGGGCSVNRCCHVCLCFQVLIAYMSPVQKHGKGCESPGIHRIHVIFTWQFIVDQITLWTASVIFSGINISSLDAVGMCSYILRRKYV